MKSNKNTLSRQRSLIIILVCLCLLLAACYFAATYLFKEQENTVLRIDEKGDYVEAVISDNKAARGISISYINNKSTKQKINRESFKRVSLPTLHQISSLNNERQNTVSRMIWLKRKEARKKKRMDI